MNIPEKMKVDRLRLGELTKDQIIDEYLLLKYHDKSMFKAVTKPLLDKAVKFSPTQEQQEKRGKLGGDKKHEHAYAEFKTVMDKHYDELNPNRRKWNWSSLAAKMLKSYNYKIDPDTLKKYMVKYNDEKKIPK